MKKESSNQFTEGLVCDLNPINTPNTVLTDALNATIITYDGNEYSLQNDRGNYPLENCRLKPNYIPVGLKEYGDILYIVSYNPLDDSVEIGTYPSPMEINSSKDNKTSLDLLSVLEFAEDGDKYSDLIENCETKVWTSDNEEDSKIYPGDKYKIEETEKSPYKYETLEYYIIDEDRKKYNITDLIFQKEPDKNGFRNVSWQIPGWLATQYRLATFDDFSMNIRSLVTSTTKDDKKINCSLKLNFQFKISDLLFLPSDFNKSVNSDIYIKIEINGKHIKDISLSAGNFIDWYSDSKILWVDTESIRLTDLDLNTPLYIKATPYVNVGVDLKSKNIIYDSFIEERTVMLNHVGNYSDFNIGTEVWKFFIDPDSNEELYLTYNIVGPHITASEVNLYYRVLDLDENELVSWRQMEYFVGVTNQSDGIIPFEGEFKAEGIYILEFAFNKTNAETDVLNNGKSIKKLVIASEIFTDFVGKYSNFNDISFDTWIVKYKDSLKAKSWKIEYTKGEDETYSNFVFDNKLIINNSEFKNKALKNLWDLNYTGKDVTLFKENDWEEIKNRSEKLISGTKNTLQITIESDADVLEGPLWDGTSDIVITTSSAINSSEKNNKSRKDLSQMTVSANAIFGNQLELTYENINSFNFASNLSTISSHDIPVMHVYFEVKEKIPITGGVIVENSYVNYKMWNLGTVGNLKYGNETSGDYKNKYYGIDNDVAKSINSLLGTKQVGVLFTSICLYEAITGKMRYRHGDTVIWEDGNGSETYLFTYLVFRKTDSSSFGIIQIDDSELWNKHLGPKSLYKIIDSDYKDDIFSRLKHVVGTIFDNITLCTKNNSIEKGYCVQINYKDPEILPVCNIDVSTKSFSTWVYKTKNRSYDLLSQKDRQTLKQRCNFCGKLFDGDINKIDSVNFYQTEIKNTNTTNVFVNVINNILDINDKTLSIEPSDFVKELEKRANTKGVYYTGDKTIAGGLIDLLDSKYSTSAGESLIIGNSNLTDANIYITGSKNGIVFANVNTETYVKL